METKVCLTFLCSFMSTLITAVLTHHLAWVPTVMPAGGSPSATYLDKHSAKWVDTLARSHPYNPLWAQLGYVLSVLYTWLTESILHVLFITRFKSGGD